MFKRDFEVALPTIPVLVHAEIEHHFLARGVRITHIAVAAFEVVGVQPQPGRDS